MKFLERIKELIHNFTNPVEDSNAPIIEVTSDNLVAIAKECGMCPEDIAELLKNRNGIELVSKKKANIEKTSLNDTAKNSQNQTIKRKDNGLER